LRFLLLSFLLASFLKAQTPYQLGKELNMQKGCYSCHGTKAEGMHRYPRLSNRAKGFLSYKLEQFRDKKTSTQQQEMMIPFALHLSDEDIDRLTTFLYEFKEDNLEEQYDDSFRTQGDGGS